METLIEFASNTFKLAWILCGVFFFLVCFEVLLKPIKFKYKERERTPKETFIKRILSSEILLSNDLSKESFKILTNEAGKTLFEEIERCYGSFF